MAAPREVRAPAGMWGRIEAAIIARPGGPLGAVHRTTVPSA